jgi:hypothetical protein
MTLNDFLAKAGDLFKPGASADATAELSAVQAEVTKLNSQLAAKDGELSTAKSELKTAQDKIVSLESAATAADTAHKTALEAKEADVEKRASAKAGEIIAKQGVKFGTIKADKAEPDKQTITQKCLAANGKA